MSRKLESRAKGRAPKMLSSTNALIKEAPDALRDFLMEALHKLLVMIHFYMIQHEILNGRQIHILLFGFIEHGESRYLISDFSDET